MAGNVPRSLRHLALSSFLLAGCASSHHISVEDVVTSRPPLSEPEGAQLVSVLNQDCRVWSLFPDNEHSFRWKGPCTNGKAHGRGALAFLHGDVERVYEGTLENGWMQGVGTLRFQNVKSRGMFRRGKFHGRIVTKFSNEPGSVYKIDYWNGIQHGQLIVTHPRSHPSGIKYAESQVRNDEPEGRGIVKLWSGEEFTETYRNGQQVANSRGGGAATAKKIGTALLQGLGAVAETTLNVAGALAQGAQAHTQSNAYRQGEALRQAEAAASSQRMLDSICITNCSDSSTIIAPSALSPTPKLEVPGVDLDKYNTAAPSVNIEVQPSTGSVWSDRQRRRIKNQYQTSAPPLNCKPHKCSDGSVLDRRAQRRDGTWFCNYELVCAR